MGQIVMRTTPPIPPTSPAGYHLATADELKCLPAPPSKEEVKRASDEFKTGIGPSNPPPLDPKRAAGALKPQLQLIPPVFNELVAAALSQGARRYGPWNWRENKVEMMTYLGAMKRHIDALLDGEDIAPDSGVHHLGHIAASCAIVLDAGKHGTLVDNRPPSGRQANFKGADLVMANFTDADLRAACFVGADLRRADFTGANLGETIFDNPPNNITPTAP